ncbi:MAG TPA: PKD domain-containing protein, partial [Candidatus Peribacteria bacterium]|nr:PKD domain-containing protein [Candidatus Peribacteria bacterium]
MIAKPMPQLTPHKRLAALASTFVVAATVFGGMRFADAAGQMSIQIEAGRVFEMTIDSSLSRPEYSWILTRDRKFINAQRAKFFQTRQTVAGTYVLDVNIQDTVNNGTEYHVFDLVVNPATDTPRPRRQVDGDMKAVLTAEPWNGSDTITLPPEGGIVKLDMGQSVGQIATFSLDLDTGVDSDGDGDPENDHDNALTAGEKDATPLYVLMAPKDSPRRVILTVTDPDNTRTSRAILNVSFGGTQPTTPTPGTTPTPTPTPTPALYGTISAEKKGLTVSYDTRIDSDVRMSKELLLEWDFGDRSRSLLDHPVHTYVKSGIYNVKLTVRDISNGEVFMSAEETVQVQPDVTTTPPTPTPTPTPPTTPVKVTPTPVKTGSTAGSFGSVVKVILIVFFLLALAVGAFFVLKWLKNKTTGKLQDTLEKMENTLVEKQEKKEGETKTSTMKLKKEKKEKKEAPPPAEAAPPAPATPEEISDRETAKSDLKTGEGALAAAPMSQDAPVPDWLKGASTPAPVAEAKPAEPAPLAGETAPVPDWLKGASTTPVPTVATATPAPAPAADTNNDPAAIPDWLKGTPTPAPAPTVSEPAPAPAPLTGETAPVPDWLRGASTPAAAAEAKPAEPAPLAGDTTPV